MAATSETVQNAEQPYMVKPPVEPETEGRVISQDMLKPGLSSPGPGAPSSSIVPTLTASAVPGNWTFIEDKHGPTVRIKLAQGTGPTAGKVELLSEWNLTGEPPETWIYLSFGQLTLVGLSGHAIWSGVPEDGNTIVGSFTGDAAKTRLVHE